MHIAIQTTKNHKHTEKPKQQNQQTSTTNQPHSQAGAWEREK
jgi:hypothetical protein